MSPTTPERLSPVESSKDRPRFHEINLKSNEGKIMAHAHLSYRNDVVPSYYVDFLEVVDALQNKGIGQKLVEEIGVFLKEKKSTGFLYFLKDSPKTEYIYQKMGWQHFRDTDFMFFNMPEYVTDEDKSKMIAQIKASFRRSRD